MPDSVQDAGSPVVTSINKSGPESVSRVSAICCTDRLAAVSAAADQ
jgi:hypothetical protein